MMNNSVPLDIIHIFQVENTEYHLVFDLKKTKDDFVILRSSIVNSEDASKLVKEFGKLSDTSWIVHRIRNPKKLIFSKTWVCQQSGCRKKTFSKRNSNCRARILISIREINERNKKLDEFLRLPVPLPAEIRIDLKHSHQIKDVGSLRMLRVSDEVQERFFYYFSKGLTPAVAKRFHEDILMKENYLIDLANASKNPTFRQVMYLYDKWREINVGPVCQQSEKLKEDKHFEESGATVKFDIQVLDLC